MKSSVLFLLMLIVKAGFAQLPPNAQALYNEFYNSNTVVAQYCINNGAQAVATADGNSFYLKWFPPATTPSNTPLMVTLHGTGSNAFNVFYFWHQKALLRGVGIIAFQWYRGAASVSPNDYFDDTTLYTYIDTALKRIKYPPNKALLNGFSRGSARTYALQFKDVQPGGKNYFCTILSNAGKPDSLYPLYQQINTGIYGHTFCTGKRWAMFCGGQDPNPARDGCPGMNSAKTNWVMANGGSVGLFIQDPALGHSGLSDTPLYMDSVLKYYLPCFNVTGLKEVSKTSRFTVFPNPTETELNIENEQYTIDKVNIYNCLGTLVKTNKQEGIKTRINVSDLAPGLYFIEIGETRTRFIKK